MEINKIYCGDSLTVLKTLPDEFVDCCITSPPYWGLRDYGVEGQLGLEKTPEEYVNKMVGVFREVKRVLKKEGTLWLNLGDSYAGSSQTGGNNSLEQGRRKERMFDINRAKDRTTDRWGGGQNQVKDLPQKNLVGIPWRVAFALQADSWYLRQDIIWHKPNPMPESVADRCTKSHEYIFLLAKSQKYYFDNEAIKEIAKEGKDLGILRSKKQAICNHPSITKRQKDGVDSSVAGTGTRNKRSVWTITTKPFKGAHFATFPEDLITPMILAGCPQGGVCLDPFVGAGTTGLVARKLGRNYIGIELNPKYIEMAEKRIGNFLW